MIIATPGRLQDYLQRRLVKLGAVKMLVLDEATAKSIQGPATMDGIGPTQGWEIFWMETDVKRRRGAPWAAPVPKDIAGKVHHLITAAE